MGLVAGTKGELAPIKKRRVINMSLTAGTKGELVPMKNQEECDE